MQMYTRTRLTTAIHRRLSLRLFLRGRGRGGVCSQASNGKVLRLASSFEVFKYHSIPLKRWNSCCKKISLYCHVFLTEPIPYHSGCRRGRTDIIESESPCPEELKDKIEVPYEYGNAEVHIRVPCG